MKRRHLCFALALPVVSLTGCLGSPTTPGQQAQECVNETLGGIPAPPPLYITASQEAVGEGYAALYVNGTVAVNPREAGKRTAAHESVRQWGQANGRGANPGERYFAKAERACGGYPKLNMARVYRGLGVM